MVHWLVLPSHYQMSETYDIILAFMSSRRSIIDWSSIKSSDSHLSTFQVYSLATNQNHVYENHICKVTVTFSRGQGVNDIIMAPIYHMLACVPWWAEATEPFHKQFMSPLLKSRENSFTSILNWLIQSGHNFAHDTTAVVSCAKLWHDMMIIFHARATHILEDLDHELIIH